MFPLGDVIATRGALSILQKAEQLPCEFLEQHKQNATLDGERLLSKHVTSEGDGLYIVTEADHRVTHDLAPPRVLESSTVLPEDVRFT